ncbi:MAG: DUF4386 domain-containing protein [Anaerolineales bacterium]|nr:DUF4386 domain-containing protein [Anaerolineales bacterium]
MTTKIQSSAIRNEVKNQSNEAEAASRKTAVLVGVLFIIGTAAGILSGVLTIPIFDSSDILAAVAANPSQLVWGAILVLVMGFAVAMIPVLLYPIFKNYNEVLALGAVIFRGVLEAGTYIGIVVCWLLLISLSQMAKTDTSTTLSTLLLETTAWINLMLAIVFSLGALMIYYLFFQSRLIPRWLSGWGFIGAILYLAAPLLIMFDPQHPPLSLDSGVGVLMAPLALQEMVLAVWLIVKGFNNS